MQTISLISSISWNSPQFINQTLLRLKEQGLIDWGHWIFHKAEEDEKKNHIHFIVQPSKRINTAALQNEFKEFVPSNDKPLSCNPFVKSKLSDWLLYAVHDVKYLIKKGQTRKHHYTLDDIQSTDEELVREQWRENCDLQSAITDRLLEYIKGGATWGDVVKSGLIPIQQVIQWRIVWDSLIDCTFRNGRKGHGDEAQTEES